MELKVKDGAYVLCGGGLERVSGAEEIAQRVVMKLTARKGSFAPLPSYGSTLHQLLYRAKPSEYQTIAMQSIAQALADEPEVAVTETTVTVADEDTLQLKVYFTVSGVNFQTDVTI